MCSQWAVYSNLSVGMSVTLKTDVEHMEVTQLEVLGQAELETNCDCYQQARKADTRL